MSKDLTQHAGTSGVSADFGTDNSLERAIQRYWWMPWQRNCTLWRPLEFPTLWSPLEFPEP